VATAATFLLGPDAGFITGTDLLIDGGVIAALRVGRVAAAGLTRLDAQPTCHRPRAKKHFLAIGCEVRRGGRIRPPRASGSQAPSPTYVG
jgi:hypothetical protein